MIKFYGYKRCSTSKKAQKWLDQHHIAYEYQDLVVDTREYGPLISKIHEIDPDAFIITDTVARVHGGQWGL